MATKTYSLPYTGAKIQTAIEYALNGSNELQGKQDKLTFDSSPTKGSSNPVTSDGVHTALEAAKNYIIELTVKAEGGGSLFDNPFPDISYTVINVSENGNFEKIKEALNVDKNVYVKIISSEEDDDSGVMYICLALQTEVMIVFENDLIVASVYDDNTWSVEQRKINSGSSITVDSELSTTSKNPVQNKVITNEIVGIGNRLESVEDTASEAESIAKGCQQAISFPNYGIMCGTISTMEPRQYNIGQNIMIVTLDVPDLWISGYLDEPIYRSLGDDADFVEELKDRGVIEVGYYQLSQLETQKVNLTEYATHQDVQTNVDNVMTEIIFRGIVTEDELYEKVMYRDIYDQNDVYLYRGANKPYNQPAAPSPYPIYSTEVNADDGYFVAPIQNMRIFKIGDVLNPFDPSEETQYTLTITDIVYSGESVFVYCEEELPYSRIDVAYTGSQLTFDVSDGDLLLASQVSTGTWVYINLSKPVGGTDVVINVDSRLSEISTNPVQNKVITNTIVGIDNRLESVGGTASEARAIALGANRALSYASYEAMYMDFREKYQDELRVGQNIYIVTRNIPDLWVSGISDTFIPSSYTSDEEWVDILETTGAIQVGYYILSPLETQKVNLADYQEKLTFDDEPISNSKNPVTSEGIKLYVDEQNLLYDGVMDKKKVDKHDNFGTAVIEYDMGSIEDGNISYVIGTYQQGDEYGKGDDWQEVAVGVYPTGMLYTKKEVNTAISNAIGDVLGGAS